jgi:hypothetical protein
MKILLLIIVARVPKQIASAHEVAAVVKGVENAAFELWGRRISNPLMEVTGKLYQIDTDTMKMVEVPIPEVKFEIKEG